MKRKRKREWAAALTLAAIATGFSGCTGSKIKEGVPADAKPQPPLLMPNMAPTEKGANPLNQYNNVMTKKADAKAGS